MNSLMNLKNKLMATADPQHGETVEDHMVIDAEMGENVVIKHESQEDEKERTSCSRGRCCLMTLLGLTLAVAGVAGFLHLYIPGFWMQVYRDVEGRWFPTKPVIEPRHSVVFQAQDELEYVTSRCNLGFGGFRIPDDNQVWYCQICGQRHLEPGSLAFGCKKTACDDSLEWDNVGCCLDCCKTLGPRMAKSVLMDRDNASFDEDNGDLPKFFPYLGKRDEEGFGIFMCRSDDFFCPLCPEGRQKDNLGYKKLAYGCQTNFDSSSEDRAFTGCGCCMQCVNDYGSFDAVKQELKEYAMYKDGSFESFEY